MSWINDEHRHLGDVFAAREPLADRFEKLYASFWEDGLVPRRVLELTRLRIAAIHDAGGEWSQRDPEVDLSEREIDALQKADFSSFSECEQAALEIAEKTPWQHHSIRDAEVKRLETALGTQGAVSLLTALTFFDMRCRLGLALGIGDEVAVDAEQADQ